MHSGDCIFCQTKFGHMNRKATIQYTGKCHILMYSNLDIENVFFLLEGNVN
jgi:hypothetical protein